MSIQEFQLLECVSRDPDTHDILSITYKAMDITFAPGGMPTQIEFSDEVFTISWHEAIHAIENGAWQFWVYAGERLAKVEVVMRNNKRFLRTEPDDTTLNNLSVFRDCP